MDNISMDNYIGQWTKKNILSLIRHIEESPVLWFAGPYGPSAERSLAEISKSLRIEPDQIKDKWSEILRLYKAGSLQAWLSEHMSFLDTGSTYLCRSTQAHHELPRKRTYSLKRHCAAFGCDQTTNLSLIPKPCKPEDDKVQYELHGMWASAVTRGRSGWEYPNSGCAYLCKLHFESSCFTNTGGLKPTAVPTKFLIANICEGYRAGGSSNMLRTIWPFDKVARCYRKPLSYIVELEKCNKLTSTAITIYEISESFRSCEKFPVSVKVDTLPKRFNGYKIMYTWCQFVYDPVFDQDSLKCENFANPCLFRGACDTIVDPPPNPSVHDNVKIQKSRAPIASERDTIITRSTGKPKRRPAFLKICNAKLKSLPPKIGKSSQTYDVNSSSPNDLEKVNNTVQIINGIRCNDSLRPKAIRTDKVGKQRTPIYVPARYDLERLPLSINVNEIFNSKAIVSSAHDVGNGMLKANDEFEQCTTLSPSVDIYTALYDQKAMPAPSMPWSEASATCTTSFTIPDLNNIGSITRHKPASSMTWSEASATCTTSLPVPDLNKIGSSTRHKPASSMPWSEASATCTTSFTVPDLNKIGSSTRHKQDIPVDNKPNNSVEQFNQMIDNSSYEHMEPNEEYVLKIEPGDDSSWTIPTFVLSDAEAKKCIPSKYHNESQDISTTTEKLSNEVLQACNTLQITNGNSSINANDKLQAEQLQGIPEIIEIEALKSKQIHSDPETILENHEDTSSTKIRNGAVYGNEAHQSKHFFDIVEKMFPACLNLMKIPSTEHSSIDKNGTNVSSQKNVLSKNDENLDNGFDSHIAGASNMNINATAERGHDEINPVLEVKHNLSSDLPINGPLPSGVEPGPIQNDAGVSIATADVNMVNREVEHSSVTKPENYVDKQNEGREQNTTTVISQVVEHSEISVDSTDLINDDLLMEVSLIDDTRIDTVSRKKRQKSANRSLSVDPQQVNRGTNPAVSRKTQQKSANRSLSIDPQKLNPGKNQDLLTENQDLYSCQSDYKLLLLLKYFISNRTLHPENLNAMMYSVSSIVISRPKLINQLTDPEKSVLQALFFRCLVQYRKKPYVSRSEFDILQSDPIDMVSDIEQMLLHVPYVMYKGDMYDFKALREYLNTLSYSKGDYFKRYPQELSEMFNDTKFEFLKKKITSHPMLFARKKPMFSPDHAYHQSGGRDDLAACATFSVTCPDSNQTCTIDHLFDYRPCHPYTALRALSLLLGNPIQDPGIYGLPLQKGKHTICHTQTPVNSDSIDRTNKSDAVPRPPLQTGKHTICYTLTPVSCDTIDRTDKSDAVARFSLTLCNSLTNTETPDKMCQDVSLDHSEDTTNDKNNACLDECCILEDRSLWVIGDDDNIVIDSAQLPEMVEDCSRCAKWTKPKEVVSTKPEIPEKRCVKQACPKVTQIITIKMTKTSVKAQTQHTKRSKVKGMPTECVKKRAQSKDILYKEGGIPTESCMQLTRPKVAIFKEKDIPVPAKDCSKKNNEIRCIGGIPVDEILKQIREVKSANQGQDNLTVNDNKENSLETNIEATVSSTKKVTKRGRPGKKSSNTQEVKKRKVKNTGHVGQEKSQATGVKYIRTEDPKSGLKMIEIAKHVIVKLNNTDQQKCVSQDLGEVDAKHESNEEHTAAGKVDIPLQGNEERVQCETSLIKENKETTRTILQNNVEVTTDDILLTNAKLLIADEERASNAVTEAAIFAVDNAQTDSANQERDLNGGSNSDDTVTAPEELQVKRLEKVEIEDMFYYYDSDDEFIWLDDDDEFEVEERAKKKSKADLDEDYNPTEDRAKCDTLFDFCVDDSVPEDAPNRRHSKYKFVCERCGFATPSQYNGESHVLRIHIEAECLVCKENFVGTSRRDKHMEKHHSKEFPEYFLPCPQCARLYRTKERRNTHISRVHNYNKPVTCNICSKVFKKDYFLQMHTRIHDNYKPIRCNFCNYSCAQRNSMNWHMKKHKQGKSFDDESMASEGEEEKPKKRKRKQQLEVKSLGNEEQENTESKAKRQKQKHQHEVNTFGAGEQPNKKSISGKRKLETFVNHEHTEPRLDKRAVKSRGTNVSGNLQSNCKIGKIPGRNNCMISVSKKGNKNKNCNKKLETGKTKQKLVGRTQSNKILKLVECNSSIMYKENNLFDKSDKNLEMPEKNVMGSTELSESAANIRRSDRRRKEKVDFDFYNY